MLQYFYFYLVNAAAATPIKGGKLFKGVNCTAKLNKQVNSTWPT